MIGIKFIFFILLLQLVPSLLSPLPQADKSSINDLVEFTTETVQKDTKHDTILDITVKEGKDLIKIKLKEMTLDPNIDENDTNISTKVKKSTASIENVTEPGKGLTEDLDAEATAVTTANVKDLDASKHDTAVIIDEDLEHPKAETPSFRSLVPLLKLKNHVPIPIIFRKRDLDLAQEILKGGLILPSDDLPIDGLIGNAFDFIRRLKRDTEQTEKDPEDCNSVNADGNCEPKSLKKLKINLNTEEGKQAIEDILNSHELNSNDAASSTVLSCPISIILKIVSEEILDQIDDSVLPENVRTILTSIAKGNDDTLDLLNKELSVIPIPIKIKVDLQNEETKKILNELSNYVDTALCSIS